MSLLMLTHFAQIRIGKMCMDSLEIRQMLAHAKPSNDAFVWWSMSLIASNLYWWKFIHWDGFDSESWFFFWWRWWWWTANICDWSCRMQLRWRVCILILLIKWTVLGVCQCEESNKNKLRENCSYEIIATIRNSFLEVKKQWKWPLLAWTMPSETMHFIMCYCILFNMK